MFLVCSYFFIVMHPSKNDFVYKKECPIEMERDGKIYVKSGIKDGDKIVDSPSTTLKEGLRVKCI